MTNASDTGAVTVIIQDPSCPGWTSINDALATTGEGLWNDRD